MRDRYRPKLSNSPFRTPPRKACHSSGVNRRTGPPASLLLRIPMLPSTRSATSTQLPFEKLNELLTQTGSGFGFSRELPSVGLPTFATSLIVGFRPAYNYRAQPCATTLRSYPPWSLSDITCPPESQLLISNHDYDPAVQTYSGVRSSNRSNRGTPREPAAAKRCCRLALLHVGPLASP